MKKAISPAHNISLYLANNLGYKANMNLVSNRIVSLSIYSGLSSSLDYMIYSIRKFEWS